MSDDKKELSIFIKNLEILSTPEGMQKYILGKKKNGDDRALYDVIKDQQKIHDKKNGKKKKKKHHDDTSAYEFYIDTKKSKKKKKKNKNKKYWHI